MPIFEYECQGCGKSSEIIMSADSESPRCGHCGSMKMEKRLSAPSSMSGAAKNRLPGLGDTTCCGSLPGEAAGCAGPGSCCGRNKF